MCKPVILRPWFAPDLYPPFISHVFYSEMATERIRFPGSDNCCSKFSHSLGSANCFFPKKFAHWVVVPHPTFWKLHQWMNWCKCQKCLNWPWICQKLFSRKQCPPWNFWWCNPHLNTLINTVFLPGEDWWPGLLPTQVWGFPGIFFWVLSNFFLVPH